MKNLENREAPGCGILQNVNCKVQIAKLWNGLRPWDSIVPFFILHFALFDSPLRLWLQSNNVAQN
jgi:hypothetical protein